MVNTLSHKLVGIGHSIIKPVVFEAILVRENSYCPLVDVFEAMNPTAI